MTQELLESMRALRIGRPLVVAIDGPSGSGKSSVSKEVARRLRLAYLDTGAMYRALTWYCVTEGIDLEDGPVRVDDFAVVDTVPGKSLVRVTLHEGRKHIVRRLLAEVGFPVRELVRTDIGEVTLGDQRPGSIRVLTQKEIGDLYTAVGL